MMRLLLLLLILPGTLLAQPKPAVLTSVGPLQLIAAEILQGNGSVEVLIDPQSSPHHFQLKPSHLRKIERADLLIWISDDFETGVAKLQADLDDHALRLQIADQLPQQDLIGSGHDLDGHVWLSADNAKRIGELIADRLSRLDADNAAFYHANAHRLNARLESWTRQATTRFQQQKPAYIANHRFLAYLEKSLHFQSLGHLRNSHDHGGRLRSLARLHERLEMEGAKCLLVDRMPASRQVQQMAERHQLKIRHVDILGGLERYPSIIDLYQQTADALATCR